MDESNDTVITLPGGGPKCPKCEGPTYLVTESRHYGQKPWWCPDCNKRVEGNE